MLSDSGNCCWGAFFVLHIRKLPALIAKSDKLRSSYWVMCFKISTILKNR